MQLNYNIIEKAFDQLSLVELYKIWDLREEVFMIEQHCEEKEADFRDLESIHLMIFEQDVLIGYARVLPAGVSYPQVSIGRVVVRKSFRKLKLGQVLMQTALEIVKQQYGKVDIKISAQQYLLEFYKKFHFESVSDVYLEGGIPHVKMLRNANYFDKLD